MAEFESTTRWRDTQKKDIHEVLDFLANFKYEPSGNSNIIYSNFKIERKLKDNGAFKIGDKECIYNYIEYSYDTISPGDMPVEDRTQPNSGFIIIYFDSVKVNYIINRNNDALRNLRMLLGYTGKNEIEDNSEKFDDDFFMWLIKKVFLEENSFSIKNQNGSNGTLLIDSILRVKGEAYSLTNKVTAEGDAVMNLITTLSFILESGALKQILLRLSLDGHEVIEMRFNDKNIISVKMNSYSGLFENYSPEQKQAEIFLLLYLVVLPQLVQEYEIEKEEGLWNDNVRENFFDQVSDELFERVKQAKERRKKLVIPVPIETKMDA